MRILIVNDDGIHAKGIKTLAARLKREHDVTVVAPESERSATSHSITIYRPLRVTKTQPSGLEGVACYVVDGQPVDCTKIGIAHIMDGRADLVVSGINHGANLGSDILYSGTVAAALDAVIMGYKALAVSCASDFPEHFEAAAEVAARLIERGFFDDDQGGVLYNLNVPDMPLASIKGIKAAVQGRTAYDDAIELREDPRGNKYIWVTGTLREQAAEEDTDTALIRNGYASVTPIKFDLTARDRLQDVSCRISKLKLPFGPDML